MKKFVLVWGLISLLGINGCFAEKQFVNPLFNKTLYAYSRGSWNTLLTPSTITEYPPDSSVSGIDTQKHSCKLLENEFDHIKYDCHLCYQAFFEKEKTCFESIILFKILNDGKIQALSFDPGKDIHYPEKDTYYSREHFVIHP